MKMIGLVAVGWGREGLGLGPRLGGGCCGREGCAASSGCGMKSREEI